MNKILYAILITMMCCAGLVFAQQQYKTVETPQTKNVQILEKRVDAYQQQINELRNNVANLGERIRKLEQHIAVGSGGNVTITATKLNIQASAQMEIRSSATMDIRSGLLRLNNGKRPVAHMPSDLLIGRGFQNHPVVGLPNIGSPTVLVP
jgi:uncharacterized FAD-dependent dehydrogenase